MKQLLVSAVGSALLAAIAISAPAYAASDIKVYHGSDCKVFGATAWTDLNFNGFGVRNVQTTGRNIICPLVKDFESSVDNATNFASLHMHFFAPPGGRDRGLHRLFDRLGGCVQLCLEHDRWNVA